MSKLSPEFLLIAACCRWPPSAERDQQVRGRAEQVDWGRVLRIARRQRVEGLVSDALSRANVELPPDVGSSLGHSAAEIARLNLGFAAESRRLHQLLNEAAVPHLFVKGATLDMLAYGSLALKRGRDIDMLIEPNSAVQASRLLAETGYDRVIPGPEIGPDQFGEWVTLCKESNWRHPASRIIVELHTELVDTPQLLGGVGLGSPCQTVKVAPNIELPTLATEQLYAYLCVHGATHAWSRLKWIADVAALLASFDLKRIEQLHRACEWIGAGRSSAQALLLCAHLFETALPAGLKQELERSAVNRWLLTVALSTMAGRHAETELDDTLLGTLPIHLSHFALGSGMRFKGRELLTKLNNREDRMRMKLPRPLHFLYPIIALPSWAWRRVRGPTAFNSAPSRHAKPGTSTPPRAQG
jgi:hypothetical protein